MKLRIPQATARGYIEVPPRGIFDFSYPDSPYRRGRVQGGGKICPGLMAGSGELMVYENVYEIIRSDTNKKRWAMERGAHYSHLEIGRRTMNSLTRVAKDTLVIEVYETNKDKVQCIQKR